MIFERKLCKIVSENIAKLYENLVALWESAPPDMTFAF